MNKILNILAVLAIYFPDAHLGATPYIFKTLFTADVVNMSKGNHIATFHKWGKEYSVSFKFVPSSFVDAWSNVFHMTSGPNCCSLGQRHPYVTFRLREGEPWMQVQSDLNGAPTFTYNKVEPALQVGKPIQIDISQKLFRKNYIYSLLVNGKLAWAEVNAKPMEYADLKLYCGDTFYPAQKGKMYDLKVETF